MTEDAPEDLWAVLDQARAHSQGQPAAHWQRIDALARRTQAHQGAVRALLETRLRALLDKLPAPADTVDAPAAPASGLRQLLDSLPAAADGQGLPDLKTVQAHRDTWLRLRAEQQVAQSQGRLPEQAGPMNSQRLLLDALQHMRTSSPGYLQHFITQAEALLWLDQALRPSTPKPPTKKSAKGSR